MVLAPASLSTTQLIPPAPHSTTVAFSQSPEETMLSGFLRTLALLYHPEVSRETELAGCVCIYICMYVCIYTYEERERESFVRKNWLTRLWSLERLQSARHASRLETQARVDVAASTVKVLWRQNSSSRDLSLCSEAFNQVDEVHPRCKIIHLTQTSLI